MDGKRIRCLQIVSRHVPIHLQQFPSYSNRKCKKLPFSRTAAHILVSPACCMASCDSCRRRSFVRPSSVVRLIFIVISRKLSKTDLVTEEQVGIADSVVAFRCCHRRHLVHEIFSFSILYLARRVIFLFTYLLAIRGGSTLRPGGHRPPNVGQPPPPYFGSNSKNTH